MKRLLCLLLSLALLTGCASPAVPTETPDCAESTVPATTGTPAPETAAPAPTEPQADDSETLAILRENFPVIDGSTSLIPLEAGIRSVIFEKSVEEATLDVTHSTTWTSFYNLVDGYADLVFSCPLSDDQRAIARDAGVELELVSVALEGFVFVVNADNPVDSLTQQQLKDIYSGKITNWKQVGGLDEEIIPYQRNTDSGSQNFMAEFMGDTPLMDAPTELRPASMSGLMDVIAVNDNARGAIGYSVYAYAANMYGNGNEIKFIQVDGVAPSKLSFADGSYPLLGKNYAVFRADEPADSPVRALVDWMLTDRGQWAVANAGYVTVRDIGFDYTEETLQKYEGAGSGPAAADPASYEYRVGSIEHFDSGDGIRWENLRDHLMMEPVTLADGTLAYHLNCLADKALQQEINDFIDRQFVWAVEEYPAMAAHVEALNGDSEYGLYSLTPLWPMDSGWREGQTAACYASCTNGYLSVMVALTYSYQVMSGDAYFYRVETATWDLLSGRRLTAEELFCDGVDIDETLNEYLRVASMSVTDEFSGYPDLKRDFAGLTESNWAITPEYIYFDHDNPYFRYGTSFSLENLPDGTLVTEQPRETAHCFDSPDIRELKRFRTAERDFYYAYNADETVQCGYLLESAHPNAKQINDAVKLHLDTYFTDKAIRGYYDSIGLDGGGMELYMLDWNMTNLGGRYLLYRGSAPEYYIPEEDRFEVYPMQMCMIFDLETGMEIQWSDLLLPGWENLPAEDINGLQVIPDYSALTFRYMSLMEDGTLFAGLTDDTGAYYYVTVPTELIRF